ncbi:hypothetical protein PPERSA_08615 [Pseudocohnilembus persalinus]|uniref:Transmembrane protein n=1 Tax=Pseudocohnilembus persalinus TaxID=266149 RepID=A0A0V0R526_PSEPJ|nr:hypothetical protein PPERSA_08615 [Pseudocohnilembus persalinus]|eukprot:KRX09583.1 hypothetical protein PPERSA_08615 [Pseudocohnilembus persalinus]
MNYLFQACRQIDNQNDAIECLDQIDSHQIDVSKIKFENIYEQKSKKFLEEQTMLNQQENKVMNIQKNQQKELELKQENFYLLQLIKNIEKLEIQTEISHDDIYNICLIEGVFDIEQNKEEEELMSEQQLEDFFSTQYTKLSFSQENEMTEKLPNNFAKQNQNNNQNQKSTDQLGQGLKIMKRLELSGKSNLFEKTFFEQYIYKYFLLEKNQTPDSFSKDFAEHLVKYCILTKYLLTIFIVALFGVVLGGSLYFMLNGILQDKILKEFALAVEKYSKIKEFYSLNQKNKDKLFEIWEQFYNIYKENEVIIKSDVGQFVDFGYKQCRKKKYFDRKKSIQMQKILNQIKNEKSEGIYPKYLDGEKEIINYQQQNIQQYLFVRPPELAIMDFFYFAVVYMKMLQESENQVKLWFQRHFVVKKFYNKYLDIIMGDDEIVQD